MMYTPGSSGSAIAFLRSSDILGFIFSPLQKIRARHTPRPIYDVVFSFALLSEAGLNQCGETLNSVGFICAVRNNLDGGAADDAE